jgi:hypothetical protein
MDPAEREAYAELDAAIEKLMRIKEYNVCEREGLPPVPMMNVTWMVLLEQRGFDGEDQFTGSVHLFKDGDMPWTTRFGLLRIETLRMEREYNE